MVRSRVLPMVPQGISGRGRAVPEGPSPLTRSLAILIMVCLAVTHRGRSQGSGFLVLGAVQTS